MFSNFLAASLTLTDGTGDQLTAVFTDENHVWVRTTNGQVVDLDFDNIIKLMDFLQDNFQD